MDYGIIIAIAAYFAGIQSVSKFGLRPVLGALIAIGIPFVVSGLTRWILLGSNFSSIWGDVINLITLLTFIIQFSLMYVLLRYLKNTESIGAYLILGVVGYFLIILLVPFIIMKLL